MRKVRLVAGGTDCVSSDETDLAEELRRLSLDCQIVDWNTACPEPDALYVFRSCWDYHLRPEKFRAYLHTLRDLNVQTANPVEMVLWNMDKSYLLELADNGIKIPRTFYCCTEADIEKARMYFSGQGGPVVVKPAVSASAHLTRRDNDPQTIALINGAPTLVQEYLSAIESEGEISLIFFDGRFSHAVKKLPKPGDYRVQTRHGGSVRLYQPLSATVHAAEALLTIPARRFGRLPCYARVDVIENDGAPVLMELELIEPYLCMNLFPQAVHSFAAKIEMLTST